MTTNLGCVSVAGSVRLRPVASTELCSALDDALAGGPPIAPLPDEPGERGQAMTMLRSEQPVTEPDAAVVVATSGSTGHPKGVVLSRAGITASTVATHDALGGPGDWVLALPVHYVAGLMVCARAVVAGTRVVEARSDLADLGSVTTGLASRRYLSVVPTQLARALADPGTTAALGTFTAVLVGGGALDPGLRDRATGQGVRVVTTYGMSETCGGCVYDGRPLPGVDLVLGTDERISIGGPTVFSGYRLRADLTAEALVDGRLRTRDRGRWSSGRLEVLGRVDDVVMSGGLNVDLAEVERRIRSWPALDGAEVAVLGVSDPEWGTRVVAVTEGSGRLAALRQHLGQNLPAYAAPRTLVHVDVLPRTSSGKIDRPALRSLFEKGQL